MSKLPTHDELYSEYETKVSSDPSTNLVDFTPGSRLDVYAGVSATSGQSIMRFVSRQIRRFFIGTSEGTDLDVAVADRYGDGGGYLTRRPGELDTPFLNRVKQHANNLGRGTIPAIEYYARYVRTDLDPDSVVTSEDLETGIISLSARVIDGFDVATVLENIQSQISAWRPAGHPMSIEILEAV